jgi:GxxExxY protein
LKYELDKIGLKVKSQVDVPIVYDGVILSSPLRIDLMVDDSIILELKSVEELKKVHYKQLQTYLKLTDKKIGLLINFNTANIREGIHRIVM